MNEINVPHIKNPFKFPNTGYTSSATTYIDKLYKHDTDTLTELSLSNVRPFSIKLFMFLSPDNGLIISRVGYFDEVYDLYMLIGAGINESEKIAPISKLKALHIFELPNIKYMEVQTIFPGKI
jgi:hypothetical protein